ncbi:MAG: hypothetical protein RI897_3331 [Verrucomicrobiota bacterium]
MIAYSIIGGDQKEYGPVSADQVRCWVGEGRAGSATLVRSGDGAWRPLSEHPEFEDLFRGGPPPLVAVGPVLGSQPASMVELASVAEAKGAVMWPAVSLIVLAVMDGGMAIMQLIGGLLGGGMGGLSGFQFHVGGEVPMDEVAEWLAGPIGLAGSLVSLLLSGIILFGAIRMMGLRNYGFCMVVSILAVIPCTTPCCCFGIAAGIWSLVVLSRPEVKSAFL